MLTVFVKMGNKFMVYANNNVQISRITRISLICNYKILSVWKSTLQFISVGYKPKWHVKGYRKLCWNIYSRFAFYFVVSVGNLNH